MNNLNERKKIIGKRGTHVLTSYLRNNFVKSKRSQITIFVIIAIAIVAAIVIFFVVRNAIRVEPVADEFSEVYDFYESCIEAKTREALSIAGSQGGYIEMPEFQPGNIYAPFSNQLDFIGTPVPYWYYITSNGVVKEQVPSIKNIEQQIENYLNFELQFCDFSSFRSQGMDINMDDPVSDVKITDNKVRVDVSSEIAVEKAGSRSMKSNHNVEIDSDFGNFYLLARELYDRQKKEAFLENYSIDVMYNYAPTTGVEFSCSPLVWEADEVVNDIKNGLSANIQALKVRGEKNDYFNIDINTNKNVRFLYDINWPSRIEIWPSDNSLLVAEPVGLESGMGMLGFCYVPYHFVYDIYFPTLIQIYDEEDIFQFPVAVVIDKSVPREALDIANVDEPGTMDDFCNYKNTIVNVYTSDNLLQAVEADISFRCLNERCNIGKTEISGDEALLSTRFPQCINGIVTARAESFVPADYYIDTNEVTSVNIILDKLYERDLEIVVGGIPLSYGSENLAVVTFNGERYSTTVVYPAQKKISLAEGLYNVSVQVFGGASLTIPAGSRRECVEIPKAGILGFFGGTEEQCFTIDIPSQTVKNGLSGGGKSVEFILERDLQSSEKLKISAPALPSVTSLDQLSANYQLFEVQNLQLSFI